MSVEEGAASGACARRAPWTVMWRSHLSVHGVRRACARAGRRDAAEIHQEPARSPNTVRCQSLAATAVLSNMTCLIWVYSSNEYADMSFP